MGVRMDAETRGPVQDLPSAYFGVPPAEGVELGLEVEI
jgi:hypothetical protein